MTQPPGGGPSRPSPQEPTDPTAATPDTEAGPAADRPEPTATVPTDRPEPTAAFPAAPDASDGTVEFGQSGFPSPPGYPAYGQPAPGGAPHPEAGSGHSPQPPVGSGDGTVEFGQAGFPTPPGYPPYGQPAPSGGHAAPPPAGYGPPPPTSGYGPQPPTSGYGPQPSYGQPPVSAQDPRPTPPKKHRGLLISSIVLTALMLLCGGGGVAAFLLLRGETGEGAPEPVAAADQFLRAVYVDQDPDKAAALVCSAARDRAKIARKVEEVKGYRETYKNPRFRWTPPTVTEQNAERAVVATKLTMITGDERFSEQQLTIVVVRQSGWWVCDVG